MKRGLKEYYNVSPKTLGQVEKIVTANFGTAITVHVNVEETSPMKRGLKDMKEVKDNLQHYI